MSEKWRVLDLFCGAGGAAMGLHRAWADAEIIGIDIMPQPRYPFRFVQGDALKPPFDLREFDFIWASPECKGYTTLAALNKHKTYRRMIANTRELLRASGKPYVIENVANARREMIAPVMLCGSMFGLNVRRHRYFESSIPFLAPPCLHHTIPEPLQVTGWITGPSPKHRKPNGIEEARSAMDIDWMEDGEIQQAIPPAYSEYIARQIRQVTP